MSGRRTVSTTGATISRIIKGQRYLQKIKQRVLWLGSHIITSIVYGIKPD